MGLRPREDERRLAAAYPQARPRPATSATRQDGPGRAAPGERLLRPLAPVLVWLVVSVTMISVALTLGHEGKGGSLPCMAWAWTCVMQAKQASP